MLNHVMRMSCSCHAYVMGVRGMIIKLVLSSRKQYEFDEAVYLIKAIEKLVEGSVMSFDIDLKGYTAGAE